MDRAGTKTKSRLDYFLVDQETASCTTEAEIEPICKPFDHSEITLTVDFDKVTRGPGFWKFNNSHLQNDRFKEIIRIELALIVSEYQNIDDEERTLTELLEMAPDQLQKVKLILNPHELMEQIHFALKAKIIKYSIRIQKDRTRNKKEAEKTIRELNEKLQEETITQLQRREVQEMLTNKEAALEKNGGAPGKGDLSQGKTRMGHKR